MLAAILICGCKQEVPLTFLAGTYEVTAQGHNGDISSYAVGRYIVTVENSREFLKGEFEAITTGRDRK